jgi:hypothetical protein
MKICCDGTRPRCTTTGSSYMIYGVTCCIMIMTMGTLFCHSFTISSQTPLLMMRTERPSMWMVSHEHDRFCRNEGFLSLSLDDENEPTDAASDDDDDAAAVDITDKDDELVLGQKKKIYPF